MEQLQKGMTMTDQPKFTRDAAADLDIRIHERASALHNAGVPVMKAVPQARQEVIAWLLAAEARAAELERQLADERRAREAAERDLTEAAEANRQWVEEAMRDSNTTDILRERGEALAKAGFELHLAADKVLMDGMEDGRDENMSEKMGAYKDAEKAWREIAPAKPEEEKKS